MQPLKEKVSQALDGRKELASLWVTTMLQYALVDTVGGQYHEFDEIGAAALQMVASKNNISITEEKAKETLKPMRSLPAHQEVPGALSRLQEAGYTLVTLTNSANQALEEQMTNSGLKQYFQRLLSVEDTGIYKPHSRVYSWAARKIGVRPEESLMVAAHGWDIAGAKWAGWQAAFIDRPGQTLYPLSESPEITVPSLTELADILIALEK